MSEEKIRIPIKGTEEPEHSQSDALNGTNRKLKVIIIVVNLMKWYTNHLDKFIPYT